MARLGAFLVGCGAAAMLRFFDVPPVWLFITAIGALLMAWALYLSTKKAAK